MSGQHANRQGAAITVGRLLGEALAELRAERAQLAAERAAFTEQRRHPQWPTADPDQPATPGSARHALRRTA